ncbi:hypothetical protein NOGI109294_00210 [Nocardiopsis gilva]|uniref:hypothetical protein n=1 Tax=Nocardiopsis gilva TaxID=280236 RepID=UPI001E3E204D|nr:hypothetical protein [Nocardiopsis gilva]
MVPEAFQFTPNAEQYVLQADALRRRQLRAALLYGSSRYWRRRQRVWPAVIGGVILVAIICGGISVHSAFNKQQEINQERENARNPGSVTQQQNPAGQSGVGGQPR